MSLVMIAVVLLVLMGFGAIVLDFGTVWLGRGQTQNAADAGALAGAIARAFDETGATPASNGASAQSAILAAHSHYVMGDLATATVSFPDCPAWAVAAGAQCVEVNVYRDGTNGSAMLPKYLSNIFPSATLKIKAHALARASAANHSNCLKPWIIPDKYHEVTAPADTFNGMDFYTQPGYTLADIGTVLTLHPGNPHDTPSPSDYYSIGIGATYEDAITGCVLSFGLGDAVETLPGGHVGPTNHGLADLTADGPVVVPIAMYSPVEWTAMDRHSGKFTIHIVNIMGLRIDHGGAHGEVQGTIVALPGDLVTSDPNAPPGAGFLKIIELVQ
jgi:hypothetical protein